MTATKVCRACREPKPLTGFYRNRSKADGYADECKACKNAYARRPEVKARDAKRRSIVRRQWLFHVHVHRESKIREPEYASAYWYKYFNPEKREAARLEYEAQLAPPPLYFRDGRRIDA